MNYYGPRQLKDSGKWHYTVRNDSRIHAVGYCSSISTCPDCKGHSWMTATKCSRCENKGYITTDNPCPGHDTPDEAREHYRQYLLDQARFDGYNGMSQYQCHACRAWTQRFAVFDTTCIYYLCDEHCNRETLEQLTVEMGDAISSW